MRKIIGIGIIICLALLIAAPAAACHVDISKTGNPEECTTCDSYPYTITVTSVGGGSPYNNYLVRVTDTLPAGTEFVSWSDNNEPVTGVATCVSPASPVVDSTCTVIQWDYSNVPDATWTITLNVKPISKENGNEVTNSVQGKIKENSGSSFSSVKTDTMKTTFFDRLCPIPSPEFPTLALPVGLIIGMLGVVLFIQKTKEK